MTQSQPIKNNHPLSLFLTQRSWNSWALLPEVAQY